MAKTPYGRTKDGADVHAFTLGESQAISATILDFGGTITAIGVKIRDGSIRNVVLGLKDLAAYEASGTWNCLIGRYANRLKDGIWIKGRHYPLSPDANGITLHGGKGQSWGARLWEVVEDSSTLLRLRLVSPDGDQGFPGAVITEVTYTVISDGLRLDYCATADAPTVINLTNHIYFNLKGSGSVSEQTLQINADTITPTDAWQIPTGTFMPVAGTAFDFRTPVAIGSRIDAQEAQMRLAGGLDHNFVLNKTHPDAIETAAQMREPESGLRLEISTSEPGIQVYSANNVRAGRLNAAGEEIKKHDGLALETQHFPDSPNRPNFPSTLLEPGQIFRSTTVMRFASD